MTNPIPARARQIAYLLGVVIATVAAGNVLDPATTQWSLIVCAALNTLAAANVTIPSKPE